MQGILSSYRKAEQLISGNLNTILMSTAAILMVVGGIYWNQSTKLDRSYQTHSKLLDLQALKESPVQPEGTEGFTSEIQKWERIRELAVENSSYHPVFALFEANALMELGKMDEAETAFKKLISNAPNSPLTDMYKINLSLVQLSMDDSKKQNEGLKNLTAIAGNTNSPSQEMALFRLGQYAWTKGNFDEARKQWEHLVFEHERNTPDVIDKPEATYWVNEALEKLALMTSK